MSATYQLFDDLAPAVQAALRDSIDRWGVLVPVAKDQHGNILDGHQRARLADELGIRYPVNIIEVADEDEAREIARTLNEDRRPMPKEQRLPVEVGLREEGHSIRAIAVAVGVDTKQVQRDLAGVDVSTPLATRGRDGKTYPSRREPKPPPEDAARFVKEYRKDLPEPWRNTLLSTSNEWYTPAKYIEAARAVMGGIDLDPASNVHANEVVGAVVFYDAQSNGLLHDWPGRVWMNPPYGGQQSEFTQRLVSQFAAGITTEAVVLLSAHATETDWFAPLWDHTLCFTDHRINFYRATGVSVNSTHGSVFVYLGPKRAAFVREFSRWGHIVRTWPCHSRRATRLADVVS